MTAVRCLSMAEYAEFEKSIIEDPRGGAFLRQRDSRQRLIAVARMRRSLQEILVCQNEACEKVAANDEQALMLRREFQEIGDFIQQTRREIADLCPDEKDNSRILLATSELDAIVSATERATLDILNGTERIQAAVARLPKTEESRPILAEIEGQLVEIMTACSFQDITGQRTARVMNAIRYIERRIEAMTFIWGVNGSSRSPATTSEDMRPDAHLLNGPPLEGGISQNEVDSLFAASSGTTSPINQDAINELFP